MTIKILAHGLDGSRRDFYLKEDMGTPDQARQLADALHDFADTLETN